MPITVSANQMITGDASGRGPDLRCRVLAGPPVSGRRVPGRRHAGGPATGRAARPRAGGVCRRPAGRRPGGTAEGSPKLLDFGVAHAVNAAAILGGTLPYLSPEVLAGRPAEEADDVWSLCVVLDEMVSGRHPFTGGDLEQVRQGSDHRGLAGGVDVLRGKGHYGHRSRKTTWWYAVGGELPGSGGGRAQRPVRSRMDTTPQPRGGARSRWRPANASLTVNATPHRSHSAIS